MKVLKVTCGNDNCAKEMSLDVNDEDYVRVHGLATLNEEDLISTNVILLQSLDWEKEVSSK